MRIHSRIVIGPMVGLGFLMIGIVGLHLGGESVLKVGVYSQLLGAFIGGFLILLLPTRLGCQERLPHSGRSANSWAGPSLAVGASCGG